MKEEGWVRRLLGPLLRRQLRNAVLTMLLALTGMGATAASPLVMRSVIDDLVGGRVATTGIVLLLVLGLLRAAMGAGRRWFAGRVSLDVEYDLRTTIYAHVQSLDVATHDRIGAGQLVSRANSDVRMLQGLLAFLPMLTATAVMLVASIAIMISLSPPLSVVALVTVPILFVSAMRLRKTIFPASWEAQQRTAEVATVVEEAVSGVRIVKAFAAESHEIGKLRAAAERMFGSRMRLTRLTARAMARMAAIPALASVALLGFGGRLVLSERLTLGTFVAFTSYLVQMAPQVRMVTMFAVMGQMARAGGERILELLDSVPQVADPPEPRALPSGDIAFEDVTFGYLRSEPVLDGFTLHLRPGEVVALVGPSGCGKSTVTQLLPRFHDPQSGRITIGGTDIRDVRLDELRGRIGIVAEDPYIFSTSVHDNIAYGHPEATVEQVRAAARAAGAEGFVDALPDGFATVVGEHGRSLSGGQRQRIALARALLTDPDVLVLDDATSAVDARVEAGIHATLRELMRGRTVLLVAHRRSTLELADRIVVLDGGRTVAEGTQDELLLTSPLFRRLVGGPGEDIEGPDEAGEPDGVTASAWGGGGGRDVRAATGIEAGPDPSLMRHGFGMGMGMAGRHMLLNAPPTPELLEAVAKLEPVRDEPDVDEADAVRADARFTLRRFLRPYRASLAAGIGLVGVDTALTVAAPALVARAIDGGLRAGEASVLYAMTAIYLVTVLVDRTAVRAQALWMGRFAERMLYALRLKVFAHLQRLGMDFYDREMAGRIMSRMTSDIESLSQLLQQGLTSLVLAGLTLVGVAALLFSMQPRLALVITITLLPLLALTVWYRRATDAAYLTVREKIAALLASFQESLSGVREAQAFVREERNMRDFRQVAGEHLDARLDGMRLSAIYFPAVEMLGVVASAAALWYGGRLLGAGAITAGALVAFLLSIDRFFAPIQQLSQAFDLYQQANAATTKLTELLAEPTSVPDGSGRLDGVRGRVVFDRVSFRYAPEMPEVLHAIDLEIAPGETVALVGETGAGKSTIAKLVARFHDPSAGRVLVDGTDLRELRLDAYRRHLGIVPQEPFLFAGSIRDNIAYGRPVAADAEVEAAARAVGAHDMIAALPDGYHTFVHARGGTLSSGERQLIALARARLVDPRILILDEATSNLDLYTESAVQRAMGALRQGRTTILIAHRLQTAQRADRIVVLDHGRIVESGTHDELVARDGTYAALWSAYTYDAGVARRAAAS